MLTNGYKPHQCNLHHGFGSGFVLAVLDWFLDGNVAIQRNGAQMHDGGGGKQHIKEKPNGAERLWKRPIGV